ncbi:hypothetical protein [Brasilonema bromeliae]|nr:hypothetical protein [Brasilonema bromeliae]
MATTLELSSSNIADDIYNSCITRTKYIPFLAAKGSSDSFHSFLQRQDEQKRCDDLYKQKVTDVKKANSVLVEYVKALGKLASDDTASFDKNFTALDESLKNLKFSQSNGQVFSFKGPDVDAGINIAKFLTNAFTREFRREKLKKAILCTDKDIQTYTGATSSVKDSASNQPATGGLIALTQQAYINGILTAEEEQIRTYFTDYIGGLTQVSETHTLDFITLEENYNKAMDSIRSRKDAAENYVELLQKIATLHSNLKTEFQGKDQIDDAQLSNYCQDLYTTKADKAATKEKAVTYDQEELKRVRKIVSDSERTLEPLIQKMDKGL